MFHNLTHHGCGRIPLICALRPALSRKPMVLPCSKQTQWSLIRANLVDNSSEASESCAFCDRGCSLRVGDSLRPSPSDARTEYDWQAVRYPVNIGFVHVLQRPPHWNQDLVRPPQARNKVQTHDAIVLLLRCSSLASGVSARCWRQKICLRSCTSPLQAYTMIPSVDVCQH